MIFTTKSIFGYARTFTLKNNEDEVLKINYDWKKQSWIKYTEEISVDIINNQESTPDLSVYSLFLMRLIQQQEAAANSGGGAMIHG